MTAPCLLRSWDVTSTSQRVGPAHHSVDRSKGVFIETVEERAAKAEARRNKNFDGSAGIYDIKPSDLKADPPTLAFKYVCVPCDDTAPFEQLDGMGYDACDNFLTMLRAKFAGGSVDADKAQRAAVQHLGASVPTLGEKGMSTLTDAGVSTLSTPWRLEIRVPKPFNCFALVLCSALQLTFASTCLPC